MMNVPHKDKLRLDAIEHNLLIIYPPSPRDDELDGLWVICDYTLPDMADYIAAHKSLRKALDVAMLFDE